ALTFFWKKESKTKKTNGGIRLLPLKIHLAPTLLWKKETRTKKTNGGIRLLPLKIHLAPALLWKKETRTKKTNGGIRLLPLKIHLAPALPTKKRAKGPTEHCAYFLPSIKRITTSLPISGQYKQAPLLAPS
ncbi:MAG: hypothetical protein ACE5EZ_05855, partial [Thermodesulfobacteriota bacterium]